VSELESDDRRLTTGALLLLVVTFGAAMPFGELISRCVASSLQRWSLNIR
jgi:hypothetical protein